MKNETAQPFNNKQRRADDYELVEQVLGTQEADEMRELTSGQTREEPASHDLGDVDLSVTAVEQAVVNKAEFGVGAEERRRQFIAWAKELGEDEKLIDENFEFDDDGTVVITNGVLLPHGKMSWLPEGIKAVETDLHLSFSKLKDCKNMPDLIEGSLYLASSSIEDLSDLAGKTIQGSLVLYEIPATEIPDNIKVKDIYILEGQQEELARDAVEKGYNVVRLDPDKYRRNPNKS